MFVAEIGDVARFPTADRLCSWAGPTPRHRESDTKVRRGSISKQGSRLLRWAAVDGLLVVGSPGTRPQRGRSDSSLPTSSRHLLGLTDQPARCNLATLRLGRLAFGMPSSTRQSLSVEVSFCSLGIALPFPG